MLTTIERHHSMLSRLTVEEQNYITTRVRNVYPNSMFRINSVAFIRDIEDNITMVDSVVVELAKTEAMICILVAKSNLRRK